MLEMKTACERCAALLPSPSANARICSFECTWCATCADGPLRGRCPNCEGPLSVRPARPGSPEPVADAGKRPDLTRLTRKPERAPGDRGSLDALLDEILVGTLSTVLDGLPWVVPMLFARDGNRIIVHGSTGAGALRHVAAGAPAAFCVTAVDGIVVAESTFASSMNYRSAVIRGALQPLAAGEATLALDLLSDRILPGRTLEVRPSTRKEMSATMAMTLAITADNWILKQRQGEPSPPEEDHDVWCGVVPLALTAGSPSAAPWAIGPMPPSVKSAVAAHSRDRLALT